MQNIKLIACDTDGVVLEDTFSPLLYKMAQLMNIPYTREMERNTFSRDDNLALEYIRKKVKLSPEEVQDIYRLYFQERNEYIKNSKKNPVLSGANDFINRLRVLDVPIISYGGLQYEDVDDRAKPFLKRFYKYICTGSFRPGLKEIVKDIYHLDYSQVLFIDDVNTFAEEAKKHNVPFIGVPANYSWGFQKEDMEKTGVKYMVDSVNNITNDYIKKIDLDRSIWQ